MYQAWLFYGRKEAEKNTWFIKELQRVGKAKHIDFLLLIIEEITFGVVNENLEVCKEGKILTHPDFAVVRSMYPLLSEQLENMKIPVFNNARVSAICNDKAKTSQLVATLGIPVIDTLFYKHELIEEVTHRITNASVIKSVDGHGGSEVFLITGDTTEERKQEICRKIHSDFVIQPYVAGKNQDLRVYVMNNRILAAILRTANTGFKSNFSLGGSVEIYHLTDEERTNVEKIISLFDFTFGGIDFIIDTKGKLLFNEIEDVVGSRMLYQCSDIDVVSEYIDTILMKFTGEEL